MLEKYSKDESRDGGDTCRDEKELFSRRLSGIRLVAVV